MFGGGGGSGTGRGGGYKWDGTPKGGGKGGREEGREGMLCVLGVEEEEEEEEEWRALGLGVCGVDWRPHKTGREVQHAHKHTRRRGKGRKATNPKKK